MTDAEFIAQFEACTLAEFHHRDHVRAAWCYLRDAPLLVALDRFSTSLKRFARSQGKPALYHETITWAFMFLVSTRMRADETWDDFVSRHPDLLRWRPSILDRYYRPDTIASDRARHTFLFPDAL